MRARSIAVSLSMLLGACPPGQGGSTGTSTGTSAGETTGTSAGASTGASTSAAPTTGPGGTETGASSTGTSGPVGSSSTGGSSSTDPSTSSASTDASSTGSTGAGSSGSTGGGEALFLCDECTCDANVSYCVKVLAGVGPAPDPPKCPIVDPEMFVSGCALFPAECGDTPTCDCIPSFNGACFCDEQMGAITSTCPLP